MSVANLVNLAQEGLLLSVALSLPIVAVSALASLVMAVLQAMTQVHDSTLGQLPRLVAVSVSLLVAAPWMTREILAFTARAFGSE